MTPVIIWGEATLAASTLLMLLVLAVRTPLRHWAGARLGYALWVLPAMRLILPRLPVEGLDRLPLAGEAATMSALVAGPSASVGSWEAPQSLGAGLLALWLAGAVGLFTITAVRHFGYCRRLRASASGFGRVGAIPVIMADVDGPLAFGVFRRFIAVPRAFERDYRAGERALALAHEHAHHARGDLVANWASLVVLAAHWWNPVAWIAIRAFREDQEFAADARVLATNPGASAQYAQVLAKAAGIGALPACNLNARTNLKGRLMMLSQTQRSRGRLVLGAAVLTLVGSAALAATMATPGTSGAATGRQAVTIGVKPDGSGGYSLIVGDTAVAPRAPLPGGMTLPPDFDAAGGCNLNAAAKPHAMVIKGFGTTQTYTVMCARAAPAPVRATLTEGLVSLNTMRTSVATQHATAAFPEAERTHALGAIDRSIREVEATLAAIG